MNIKRSLSLFVIFVLSAMLFAVSCSKSQQAISRDEVESQILASSDQSAQRVDAETYLPTVVNWRGKVPKHPDKAWEYFAMRRADFKTRIVPPTYREEAWDYTRKYCTLDRIRQIGLKAVQAQWTQVGPGFAPGQSVPPRGRIVDLAIHPSNDSIIYAGTASGGVWKTTDQGASWTNLTDKILPSLGIGDVQLAPGAPDTIYAGLSEGLDVHWYEPLGAGLYRSTNGGTNWDIVPGTENLYVLTDIQFGSSAQTIYVAARGYQTSGGWIGAGFYKSINGGANWTNPKSDPCRSISVDPGNDQNLAASFHDLTFNSAARIYYSTNGGDSWNLATQPSNADAWRVELARSPSSPQILYALIGNSDSSLGGIWKSTDGGVTWASLPETGIPVDPNEKPSQMTYNNCINVKPDDPNTVYFGTNLRAYKSTDSGQNWASLTYWSENNLGLPVIHADHHGIAFGQNSNTVFYATDGGLFVSFDGGTTWNERNANMVCTQIYRMSNDPNNANHIVIGTQDNSMYLRKRDGTWVYNALFGDAMECIIDKEEPCYVYVTNYYGNTAVFSNNYGEDAFDNGQLANWYYLVERQAQGDDGIPDDEKGAWVVPLFVDPIDTKTVYIVLQNLYKTTMTRSCAPDAPAVHQWNQLTAFTGQPIRGETAAISYGPSNRKIFVFTTRADNQQLVVGLHRIDPTSGQSQVLTMPRLGFINAIAFDPNNNETVWIGYSDLHATPHADVERIYRSTNMGDSWDDMTHNFPRTTPVNAIFIDPAQSNTIIAGTDTGCYRSDDGGANWYQYSDELPHTTVTDFDFVNTGRILRAATYGRGVWETPLDGPSGNPTIRVEPTTINFP